jgi:GntR family transcriptional regulator, carbon starvation induced regulator
MSSTDADDAEQRRNQPTAFKSLTASVANALQRDLVAGRYMPGEKLPIVRLAKSYGVSPGAVREALSRLISEGLVAFSEQRGFRAAPVSPAALMDITRTRILIDVHALREAIRLGDVEWEAEVLSIHHRLTNCRTRDAADPTAVREEWQRLHRIFHRTLIAACGSEWLMRFHDLLFDQTIRYRSIASTYETEREDLQRDPNAEHAEIVRATVARDADTAAALLERHYHGTADRLLAGQGNPTDAPPSSN